ncbi:flagellar hook protein FlgE [Bartonella sp. DGB2]|uniref:flagellar hook protein FlgE n=1 Tax=Bartonella sp. DGB2 TaxID=3388426 RepID=UPI00398FBBAF
MGIYDSMRTGVSGMGAQANRLGGIADNVANVGTTGYKRRDSQFSDYVIPSPPDFYTSGGVRTHMRTDVTIAGGAQVTGRPGDAMINGNGFFRVSDQWGREFLTRSGSFDVDEDGYLKNSAGFYLLDERGQRVRVQGDENGRYDAEQTNNIDVGGNLDANAKVPSKKDKDGKDVPVIFDANDSSTYNQKKSVTVYDAQGRAVDVDAYWVKTGNGTWSVHYCINDDSGKPNEVGHTDVSFDKDGNMTGDGINASMTFKDKDGQDFSVTVHLGGKDHKLTQVGEFYAFNVDADGNGPGTYKGFTFDKDGNIIVSYSNGKKRVVGRVGLANVPSPNSLTLHSGTVFEVNEDSGLPQYGAAGKGGLGHLASGVLENSNVDLATELTDMIESQRNYTANSKVFQTGSELIDVVVNMKR